MRLVFFIILLDLIGFGIMVPIFPFYVLNLGGSVGLATFLMALYSGAVVITTPILGRLSDYYGRKPVLMLSLLGAVVGYVILGIAHTVWMVGLARLISGSMAGNIAAAQAYITDVTDEKSRAGGMALIGMAFGLGFIIGPPLGAWLAGDSFQEANLFAPAMVSAGLSFAAFLMAFFTLKESLSEEQRAKLKGQPRMSRVKAIKKTAAIPILAAIIITALLFNVMAGLFESLFPIWGAATGIFSTPKDMLPVFLVAGFTMVIVQGGLVRPLSNRFSDFALLRVGFAGCVLFLSLLIWFASSGNYVAFIIAMAGQAASTALVLTFLQSLVSKRAPDTERGGVMGVYSSAGMAGRTLGTVATGTIMERTFVHAPYILAIFIAVGGLVLTALTQRQSKMLNLDL